MGSTYRIYGPYSVLDSTDISGTNTYTSTAVDIASFPYAAFNPVWTGTINGTITIQVSLDTTYWYDLNVSITSPTGSAADTMIPLPTPLPYKYARLKYVNASGTGTLSCKAMAKGGM